MGGVMTHRIGRNPGVITDPNFANVVLLLGFEGADASTTLTDLSPSLHGNAGVTAQAQIDTAEKKFGVSSGLFDGTGDLFSYADSNDWNFGAGNFTVEAWINPATVATATGYIVGQWGASATFNWILYRSLATVGFALSTTGSDSPVNISGGTMVANTWYHVCADYDGVKYRVYLNGVMVASFSTPKTAFNSTTVLSIGAAGNATFSWNGWIDELRITKGVARYANDSGFSVPTAAYPRS